MSDSLILVRNYKYRLYPNRTQERLLHNARFYGFRVYNDALDLRTLYWQEEAENISRFDIEKFFGQQRQLTDYGEGMLPYDTVAKIIKRMYDAEKGFFTKRKKGDEHAGKPRYKPLRNFRSVPFRCGQGSIEGRSGSRRDAKIISIRENWCRLWLRSIGEVRMRYERPIPDDARLLQVLVKFEKDEKWYAVFSVEMPIEIEDFEGKAVGVDVGIANLITLSTGEKIPNPRWYEKSRQQRRVLQRRMARRTTYFRTDDQAVYAGFRHDDHQNHPLVVNDLGQPVKLGQVGYIARHDKNGYPVPVFYKERTTGWHQARKALAKFDGAIARKRKLYLDHVTRDLVDNYKIIVLEDISPDFMIANDKMSMLAHDVSWSQFKFLLEYKAQERGVKIIYVKPAYTSQTCFECGAVDAGNRPTQAHFHCLACGHQNHADVNAAKNILRLGLAKINGDSEGSDL